MLRMQTHFFILSSIFVYLTSLKLSDSFGTWTIWLSCCLMGWEAKLSDCPPKQTSTAALDPCGIVRFRMSLLEGIEPNNSFVASSSANVWLDAQTRRGLFLVNTQLLQTSHLLESKYYRNDICSWQDYNFFAKLSFLNPFSGPHVDLFQKISHVASRITTPLLVLGYGTFASSFCTAFFGF